MKTKSFSSKMRKNEGMLAFATSIQIVLEVITRTFRQEKEIKVIQVRKEEVK